MEETKNITTGAYRGPITFDEHCDSARSCLRSWGKTIKELLNHDIFNPNNEHDGIRDEKEMKENIILSYRHIEDAIMRLGKAIQAYEGGKSKYEK